MFANFFVLDVKYLLVGLGDGHLLTYTVESNGEFSDRRKLSLGTQPIQVLFLNVSLPLFLELVLAPYL
jgi:hypothetical protein